MDKGQSEYTLTQVESFEKQGKYLHALQLLENLIKEEDYERTSVVKLASIYARLKNVNASSELLENYLIKYPDDFKMKQYYGQFLIKNSEYEKAYEILSNLNDYENPQVQFLTGVASFNLHDFDTTLILFKEFVEQFKNSDFLPEAYLYIAKSYLEQNKLNEALENALHSEKLLNQNYDLHFTLAKIYFNKEMLFHAYESIRKAINLYHSNSELYEWAVRILIKMGDLSKAKKFIGEFEKKYEITSEIAGLMGVIFIQENNITKAKKYFKKSLQLNPQNETALKGIKQC